MSATLQSSVTNQVSRQQDLISADGNQDLKEMHDEMADGSNFLKSYDQSLRTSATQFPRVIHNHIGSTRDLIDQHDDIEFNAHQDLEMLAPAMAQSYNFEST